MFCCLFTLLSGYRCLQSSPFLEQDQSTRQKHSRDWTDEEHLVCSEERWSFIIELRYRGGLQFGCVAVKNRRVLKRNTVVKIFHVQCVRTLKDKHLECPYSIASLAYFTPKTHNLSRSCPDQLCVKYEDGIMNCIMLA